MHKRQKRRDAFLSLVYMFENEASKEKKRSRHAVRQAGNIIRYEKRVQARLVCALCSRVLIDGLIIDMIFGR